MEMMQSVENGGQQKIKGEATKSSVEEEHQLSLMRSLVESRDPSSKEVDDSTLRRFLRARDLDVEKAAGLFLKYLMSSNDLLSMVLIRYAQGCSKNMHLRNHYCVSSSAQIVFVEGKKLKSTLLEDIDENQLPDIYGGKFPLVPIQDA